MAHKRTIWKIEKEGQEKDPAGVLRRRGRIYASKTVSRVLYLTVIYLDVPLPVRSSHPGSGRASLEVPPPQISQFQRKFPPIFGLP